MIIEERFQFRCLCVAVVGSLLVLGCGCGQGEGRARCESQPLSVEVVVRTDGDHTNVEAYAHNVSDRPLYICQEPPRTNDKQIVGPCIFYGGNRTLVLHWASTQTSLMWFGPDGAEETGVITKITAPHLRRIEPGATMVLKVQLTDVVEAIWPWIGITWYADIDHTEFVRREDRVDRVLVVVGYWEESPLAWLQKHPPWTDPDFAGPGPKLAETFNLSLYLDFPLTVLPPASYRKAIVEKGLALYGGDTLGGVSTTEIELTGVVGPVALPKPLTIRYRGAPWLKEPNGRVDTKEGGE